MTRSIKANKKEVIAIMSPAVINKAVDTLVATIAGAQVTIGKAYATMRAAIVQGIPSGLGTHAAGYKEYQRRMDIAASKIFASGTSTAKSEKTVKDNLRDGLKADGFVAPMAEKSADEKEVAARERDAKRKAKVRAVNKVKAELKKANPARKFKEGELEELAAAQVQDQSEESKAKEKQHNAARKFDEQFVSFITRFNEGAKEGKFSDGTLERTSAALAATLATFREEVKE